MSKRVSNVGDWRNGLPVNVDRDALPVIKEVQHDSREVSEGDLFICIKGMQLDGHDFVDQAIANGASVLIVEGTANLDLDKIKIPLIVVENTRSILADIAAAHEGYPGKEMTVIGITGTDGKSTTAYLTTAALEGCGVKVGLLSTIETRIAGKTVAVPKRLTTQESPVIQKFLRQMANAGCEYVIIEATSHGLSLNRLDNCFFDIALFTNLSKDHLDFHGTFQNYKLAKSRLFSKLESTHKKSKFPIAILNRDDENWVYFADNTNANVITYGVSNVKADIFANEIVQWSDSSTFMLSTDTELIEASVPLPGIFNVANATAALTIGVVLDMDIENLTSALAQCHEIPGRMENIVGAPFEIIVDYAHTPKAMDLVLNTLRSTVEKRIIVVFGCAGERSSDRRKDLGEVVSRLADFSFITEEDSRSEDTDTIIAEIAEAMIFQGSVEEQDFVRIGNREEAINSALKIANPGDLVLIAGKGHEQSIERSDGVYGWDDRKIVKKKISEIFQ
ncbi:MAG: UDP-N-acetylmuramoyl-L-alanyl-D-glutamate--2,6-diaminopimelate ligase [Chloroflexi bacterium]|nr:UDP-N-acetylmuramoyl-L-alanyl-D-glutamate--2,6-diaminopimelate ligase [Chloroflexota bacterium]|tara:strand:+ start:10935 stop:12452 length:1518 start_codon:yes stop_codon:yes gene_type:complete